MLLAATAAFRYPAFADEPIGQSQLETARMSLATHYADVAKRAGGEQAAALTERIDSDIGGFLSGDVPSNLTKTAWTARLNALAALDSSLVAQLVSGAPDPIAGAHGLVERLFKSKVDGTLEPFALYVPNSAGSEPTLVILLHGNPQTEAEVLVGPYFQSLADLTGTIVAAPLARGVPGYPPPAGDDVYQVADEVRTAYNVAPHRTFLVGYSNGGFAVFRIGPTRPDAWSGVMCIAGAVDNSEAAQVKSAFYKTRIYVVNGAHDENIPPQLGKQTAQWLAGVGVPTGFYQEPTGTHFLFTLMPTLTSAWRDMIHGSISPDAAAAAGHTPDSLDLGPSALRPRR